MKRRNRSRRRHQRHQRHQRHRRSRKMPRCRQRNHGGTASHRAVIPPKAVHRRRQAVRRHRERFPLSPRLPWPQARRRTAPGLPATQDVGAPPFVTHRASGIDPDRARTPTRRRDNQRRSERPAHRECAGLPPIQWKQYAHGRAANGQRPRRCVLVQCNHRETCRRRRADADPRCAEPTHPARTEPLHRR